MLLVGLVLSLGAIVYFEKISRDSSEVPNRVGAALVRVASALRRMLPGGTHGEVIKRADLHGLSPEEVSRLLGKRPASSVPVRLSEGLSEFQIELYNFFPPDDPATAQVVVLEESWDLEGYTVTVWFRRAADRVTAFDSIEYPNDVEF